MLTTKETNSLYRLEEKVTVLEEKIDTLLEQGQHTDESLSDIKDHLHEHTSMLEFLSISFNKRLKKQQTIIAISTGILIILLFWIVFKI